MPLGVIRELINLSESKADEAEVMLTGLGTDNPALVDIRQEVVEASETLARALRMLDEEAMCANCHREQTHQRRPRSSTG
jgi:hypothetical protein